MENEVGCEFPAPFVRGGVLLQTPDGPPAGKTADGISSA
jgi:hypothetical protein